MSRVELQAGWEQTVDQAMRPALEDAVDEMAADARGLARRVAYGEGREGHYADQIEGHTSLYRGAPIGFVGAHKFTSSWLEDGTVYAEGLHVLRTTAEQSGLDVRITRRRGRRGRRGSRYRAAARR